MVPRLGGHVNFLAKMMCFSFPKDYLLGHEQKTPFKENKKHQTTVFAQEFFGGVILGGMVNPPLMGNPVGNPYNTVGTGIRPSLWV